jgi:hypothetical protein
MSAQEITPKENYRKENAFPSISKKQTSFAKCTRFDMLRYASHANSPAFSAASPAPRRRRHDCKETKLLELWQKCRFKTS